MPPSITNTYLLVRSKTEEISDSEALAAQAREVCNAFRGSLAECYWQEVRFLALKVFNHCKILRGNVGLAKLTVVIATSQSHWHQQPASHTGIRTSTSLNSCAS